MKVLELKNVQKFYKIGKNDKFQALDNINLSFEKGELVSILGESGSGKSTLMNLIGGLDSDFIGSIKIEGKDISKYTEQELDRYRKNKIGFIFQSFNLIQHLNILDNVTIAMTLSNVSKKERTERAIEILGELGLADQIYKKPNQLSGGQKQRVAIARALINDPEIILADEPTGALDSKTSQQILDIIERIAKKGKLIIMVTHSKHVASISTRTVSISDGIITEDKRITEKVKFKEEEIEIDKRKQNLSMFAAMKLSLRNMREKITRNILVSLGASIGIMSIIIMLSIGQGIENYIIDTMNDAVNPLVVEVNMKAEDEEEAFTPGPPSNEIIYFEQENIDELLEIEHVVEYENGYSIVGMGSKVIYNEKVAEFSMLNTTSSAMVTDDIAYGEIPVDSGTIISYYIAKQLEDDEDNFESLIGKTVEITVVAEEKVIKEEIVIKGVLLKTNMEMADNMGYMFIPYKQLGEIFNKYDLELKPTIIYLVSESEEYAVAIKEEIKELGYTGSMQETMVNMFMEMLDVFTYILAAIAAISLIVSSIMILVVMYISVVERTKEIGVLKAIGARRKDIKRIFTTEAFLIGVSGGLVGIGIALLLSMGINAVVNDLFGVSLVAYVPLYMVAGLAVSIIISVIAGLSPASKAAKLDPIESLRHE